ERYICSPWFAVANAGTIVSGILITVGAILLWNLWPRKRSGRMAMALMALGGLLVVAVGLFPWDTHPIEHDVTAFLQAIFQWAAMIALLVAVRGFAHWRSISRLTALFLAISVVGFVMFINALSGGTAFGLGVGALERIAFDSLVVWTAIVGLVLLRSQQMMRPNPEAQILRSAAPHSQ
ncbi:MAG TPA: DUF998 domain-containing protein, partial [Glaciihabitans sp.]|nr:DUF998 domain-containing protein [Glaciihabitans sp.]